MKVTRVSASLYFFPLVFFVVTSIYTFIDPNFEGGTINIAFRYGGFILCLLLFLFGSLLWFNQDLPLKLRFLFKLDEFDKNTISDIYISSSWIEF